MKDYSVGMYPEESEEHLPKYSHGRDYTLGCRGDSRGEANRDFDKKGWSEKDITETGLVERKPL